jgi:deazaflavin-dependent oxidoreductase (nitroreductase family)
MTRAKPVALGWQEVDMSSASAPTGYVHPTFVMAYIVNPVLKFIGSPTLTVRGRRSGLPITTPLAPFDFDGARYLVGGGGETQWVRNLRAAGEGQLRMGGKHQDIRTVEIQGPERSDRDRVSQVHGSPLRELLQGAAQSGRPPGLPRRADGTELTAAKSC